MREEESETMKRNNPEAGSLASYIVVGILLMVVLVSGLYGVQRYNDSQQNGDANQPAKEDASKDASSNKNDETPVDKTPATDDGSGDVPTEDTKDNSESSDKEDLPATGPEDTALTAFVLTAVTFAVASYIRSRYWTSRAN